MSFHANIGVLGEKLYASHTLFRGKSYFISGKIYFIWKFSSGNTDIPIIESMTWVRYEESGK